MLRRKRNNPPDVFSFVGRNNQAMAKQLRAFAKSLKKHAAMPKQPVFSDWFDTFDALETCLESLDEDRKKVVFSNQQHQPSVLPQEQRAENRA